MFELSVALKYLLPRWRQLSVSIISLISILVISLVVWLIVVFFSVTNGLEKMWTNKLIALTAPVRLLPTEAYYNSYYYQVDNISSESNYEHKSIAEKFATESADPYDSTSDEEIPSHWPQKHLNDDGSLKDIIKQTFQAVDNIKGVPGIRAHDFELTFANMRLKVIRDQEGLNQAHQGSLSHAVWLSSYDKENKNISKTFFPLRPEDAQNMLNLFSVSGENIREDNHEAQLADPKEFQSKAKTFFDAVEIKQLKTPESGWLMPKSFVPENSHLKVLAIKKGQDISRLIVPLHIDDKQTKEELTKAGFDVAYGVLTVNDHTMNLLFDDGEDRVLSKTTPLLVVGNLPLEVKLDSSSIDFSKQASQLKFHAKFQLQGIEMSGDTNLGTLNLGEVDWKVNPKEVVSLSGNNGEGVYLPKGFKENGVLVGDRGYISYYTPTASSFQEQRVPISVIGFYDPGVIPIGGKLILANPELTSLVRSAYQNDDSGMGTGINIYFDNISHADDVKNKLLTALKKDGLDKYWTVETYREYDFTKDIIQQLHSEKNLFTLIATVIIIVACSNIISMLIILVNDKKVEIGILRSMGATSTSIATIFGACGVVMGVIGSLIGTLFAVITLANLPLLIQFISTIQGHAMFNKVFYGETIPHELSYEALVFVLISTGIISLLAGIVPAVKASLLKPSSILRLE